MKDKRAVTSAANGRLSQGRPPQSMTLRVGDTAAIRYGWNTPLQLGEVKEIKRGMPRTAIIELRNGTTLWLLVETPKD